MAELTMDQIEADRKLLGMKGTNTRRGRVDDDGTKLHVANVFWTVQGEGPFSGRAAMFIRLTGCNLACTFCDTYWGDESDPYEDVYEIIWRCLRLHTQPRLFVLTGGEPTRQNINHLVQLLLVNFPLAEVQIETAGTFYRECMSWARVHTVVSPKMRSISKEVAAVACAFKYVVKAEDEFTSDGVPIADFQGTGKRHPLAAPPPGTPVFITPCDEGDEVKNAANRSRVAALAMQYGHTAQLQIHKFLEVE